MTCGLTTRTSLAVIALACLAVPGVAAAQGSGKGSGKDEPAPPSAQAIRDATFAEPVKDGKKGASQDETKKSAASKADDQPDPLTIKVQVLLDRARFFPGAIDGRDGENLQGALSAYAVAQGLPTTKTLTKEVFDKLAGAGGDPVVTDYTITEADAAGPYVEKIPPKMEAQADLESMGYTNPREMLAERFHMSRDLLSQLNPDKPLDKAGTVILVAGVKPMGLDKPKAKDLPREPKVDRVEVDKSSRDVRAFDKAGKLLAYYPASIGSEEKPAPSGETKVKGVAFDPSYTYDPKYRFKGVKTRKKFSIRPGPNNPVGLVWIDLAIPSYGIHGTPEPEKVGKTESHGCIRLTNWNARDLAAHVSRGAKVSFKED